MTTTIENPKGLENFTGLVLFSAPWCQPCKQYKPMLVEFAQNNDVPLALVNVDEHRAMAGHYEVRSVPTTFVFDKGYPVMSKPGAMTSSALEQMLRLAAGR